MKISFESKLCKTSHIVLLAIPVLGYIITRRYANLHRYGVLKRERDDLLREIEPLDQARAYRTADLELLLFLIRVEQMDTPTIIRVEQMDTYGNLPPPCDY